MIRYLTAGESHGKYLIAIIDAIPAGLKINIDFIDEELSLRQRGFGRGTRMGIEMDTVEILSGVRKGITTGSPIALMIRNKDANLEDLPCVTHPRPGHADLAGAIKYNLSDIRDVLERSSARETAIKVACGAICKLLLTQFDIQILSHVIRIGSVEAKTSNLSFNQIKKIASKSIVHCADTKASQRMVGLIKEISKRGDTLGGTFEVIAMGLPVGLGSFSQHDRQLDSRLVGALMSVQAIKAVEIGNGISGAGIVGSRFHDQIFYNKDKGFHRLTNNAGGIEGGMTNGEPLVIRAFMKPISTLMQPLSSVDIKSKKRVSASVQRSDVCAVPAAGIVGENVVAIELANALTEKFGGDSILELKRNYLGYLKQVKDF